MSNQLKTLSKSQLEKLISDSVSDYLAEDVNCTVSNMDTPNIDTEAKIEHDKERRMFFEVNLSYVKSEGY